MLKKIFMIGIVPLLIIGTISFGNRSSTSDWGSRGYQGYNRNSGSNWGSNRGGYGRNSGSSQSGWNRGGGTGCGSCSSCQRQEPCVPPKPQPVCQPTCIKRPPPCPEPKCETVECCKVRPQRKIKSDCCRSCSRVVYQQLDCCRRCPPKMKYTCRPCKGETPPCPEIIPCKMCPQPKSCCGKVSPCQCNTRPVPACSTCKDSCSLCK
ncbi:MAG: hypothetical protein ACRCSV_00425 [Chlamydiales bacterium]